MRPLPLPIRVMRRAARRALTLVELVIVVLVVGVLAAAATPTFVDSLLFHRVESAARRVKADLELARQTARRTSAAQSVSFSGTAYVLSGASGLDNPHAAYRVDLAASPYELDSVSANFGGALAVTFDGYGTPSSGGTVTLVTKRHRCVVTLDGTTGGLTITSNHVRKRSPGSFANRTL